MDFTYADIAKMIDHSLLSPALSADELEAGMNAGSHALAAQLAAIPEKIRGYGHVKESHIQKAKAEEAKLLAKFRTPQTPMPVAAE